MTKLWTALVIGFCLNGALAAETKILAFSGSTREGSFNEKLIKEAVKIAKEKGGQVTLINLADFPMPIYNADLETNEGSPRGVKELRRQMIESDAIVIASPEYNGSLTPLLLNAIDWASRDNGQFSTEAFKGKKFALMSASPGPGGGSRNLDHLSQILQNVGGEVIKRRVSVAKAHDAFDDQGALKDSALQISLEKEVAELLSSAQDNPSSH